MQTKQLSIGARLAIGYGAVFLQTSRRKRSSVKNPDKAVASIVTR
jgi:hypothetical protein